MSVWLSVDPLAGKYPSSTGYSYVENNPVVYVDPDGKYKLSAEMQKKYPELRNILKNIHDVIKDQPRLLMMMSKASGFSEEEILERSIWGNGPEVLPAELGSPHGSANGSDGLFMYINEELLEAIQALDQNSGDSKGDMADLAFIILATVLHADVHLGEILNKGGVSDVFERGDWFDEAVWRDSQMSKDNSRLKLRHIDYDVNSFLEDLDLKESL